MSHAFINHYLMYLIDISSQIIFFLLVTLTSDLSLKVLCVLFTKSKNFN